MSSAKRKRSARVDWPEVEALFDRVRVMTPRLRARTLSRATRGNPALRSEVESLLAAHERSGEFLERPPVRLWSTMTTLPVVAPDALPAGTRVADFRILAALGSGSFATVYRARQLSLDREVALKVSVDAGSEARALAQLDHPNIVRVFTQTSLRAKRLRLVCMQYVPGPTLAAVLAHPRRSLEPLDGHTFIAAIDALSAGEMLLTPHGHQERERIARYDATELRLWLGWRLAEALSVAHRESILHLDIKPSNVLIEPSGNPLLADFNVALTASTTDKAELLGGTPEYMAPEHRHAFASDDPSAAFRTLDGRADVYSLGMVLSGMGALPQGSAAQALLRRACEEDREKRFGSAAEMAACCEMALQNSLLSRALPRSGRLLALAEKHPAMATAAVQLVVFTVSAWIALHYLASQVVPRLSGFQLGGFMSGAGARLGLATAVAFAVGGMTARLARSTSRRTLLWLPTIGAGTALAFWGSVALALSALISRAEVVPQARAHLALGLGYTGLLGSVMTYALLQLVTLRALYVTRIGPGESLRLAAARELGWRYRTRLFLHSLGALPLIGIALFDWLTPEIAAGMPQYHFSMLMNSLVALGLAGAYVGVRGGSFLEKTLVVLSATASEPKGGAHRHDGR